MTMRVIVRFEDVNDDGTISKSCEVVDGECSEEAYSEAIYAGLHAFMKAALAFSHEKSVQEAFYEYFIDEFDGHKFNLFMSYMLSDYPDDEDEPNTDYKAINDARDVFRKWVKQHEGKPE